MRSVPLSLLLAAVLLLPLAAAQAQVSANFNGYGASTLSLASGETHSTPLETNSSIIGGLYYGFTPNVTLVAEWTRTMTKAWNGASASDDTIALGSLIF